MLFTAMTAYDMKFSGRLSLELKAEVNALIACKTGQTD